MVTGTQYNHVFFFTLTFSVKATVPLHTFYMNNRKKDDFVKM